MLAPWKKSYDKPRQHIKKQRHYFASKGPSSQTYGFSRSHVWTIKKAEWWRCPWMLLMLLNCGVGEDSWDFRGLQGDQVSQTSMKSVLNIGRADAEAEAPILWPSDAKNWLIWKDPDAGKDWRREEKGTTEDEMVGWHQLMGMNLSKLPELVMDREASRAVVHGVTKNWTWLSNWTELIY